MHIFFLVVTHSEPFSWIFCSTNQPGTSRFSCLVGLEAWKLPTYFKIVLKSSHWVALCTTNDSLTTFLPILCSTTVFVVDFSKMRPITIRCSSMLIYESRFLLNFASSHIFLLIIYFVFVDLYIAAILRAWFDLSVCVKDCIN